MADEQEKEIISDGEVQNDGADEGAGKGKPEKQPKKSRKEEKAEKAQEREREKEVARYKKEWEQSIVASKRVKREEKKRKLKRVLLILLVISLLITSTVYIMLLFLESNNVRITASSASDKTISLSFDKVHWSPYLDVDGPSEMTNVTYSIGYSQGHASIPTVKEMGQMTKDWLLDANAVGGDRSQSNVIEFSFYLENTSEQDVALYYEMGLSCDDHGLEDTIRVAWAESWNAMAVPESDVTVYASRTKDTRLTWSNVDALGNEYEDGGVEWIAYPVGSDNPNTWGARRLFEYLRNENDYNSLTASYAPYKVPAKYLEDGVDEETAKANFKNEYGYLLTVPFQDDEHVFTKERVLQKNDMLCVYVCIWIEGSDLDCTDAKRGGYVSLSISFATT